MALVTINGKEMVVDDGKLILDAAREAGIEIPTFCYHAKLSKLGSCRMCLVEIEGMRKLQPSCVTPVMEGMKVHTESPNVVQARKAQMEFLLINHPLDCPVCDQAGECDLQDLSFKFGQTGGRFRWEKRTFEKRDMGPSLVKEMNRCIACRRCSRYCAEISGDYAISELNRGNELEMGSFCHTPIESEFVGNTAQICPVGALTSKPFRFKARSWDLMGAETICPLCSVGCSITSESKYVSQEATQMLQTKRLGTAPALEKTEVKVLRNSATEDKGATDISLCDRGRYGYHFINSGERLKAPLVRENGKLVETTWEKAIAVAAAKLSTIVERSGGDAVGGITSGICTNEDNYVFQKFLRNVVGTNHIDIPRGRALTAQAVKRLSAMRGPIRGIKESDALLMLGSSVSTDTPVASLNAGIASRMKGAALTIITPGEQRLFYSRPRVLNPAGGTESLVIGALIKTVIENGLCTEAFNKDRKKELDAITNSVKGIDLSRLEEKTGVSPSALLETAKQLAAAKKGTILFGDDILLGDGASDRVEALYSLASLLGYTGEKGRIIYTPAAGNYAGASDMGVTPHAGDKEGLCSRGMIESVMAGDLKGLVVMGDDPLATAFDAEGVKAALGKLDFILVQDLFLTKTAEMAHVVLPSLSYAERSGTMTNLEGRVQRLNRSVKPVVGGREDWRIIAGLSSAMGTDMQYADADGVTEEIATSIPSYKEAKSAAIGRDGIFIAAAVEQSAISGFELAEAGAAGTGKDYPLQIVAGRDVFFSGSLTWRDDGIRRLSETASILVGKGGAETAGIADGDAVVVETKNGKISGTARVSERVAGGAVVVPINHPALDARPLFTGKERSVGGRLTKGN